MAITAVWLAAAAPMGLAAWVLAPALHDGALRGEPLGVALIVALAAGLLWQLALAAGLAAREARSLRPALLRRALWLEPPADPRSSRRGGRTWLRVLPFAALYGVIQLASLDPAPPEARDQTAFLGSAEGEASFGGNWGLFVLVVAFAALNTALGEELLFRGLLLPRMRGAFGRGDWLANGALFGLYHVHQPWSIPSAILAGCLVFALPSRRYRSAWMGIAVHSTQSVVIVGAVLVLTLGGSLPV